MAQRIVLATWLVAAAALGAEPVLQLATFRADVTPSIGDGPCVGFMPKVESVEHPLEVRGIVLRANGQTFVIAALDYQGLCNSSDDEFRRRMADAAGTTPGRVALQSLHQHSAPALDADAMRLLHGDDSEPLRRHIAFTMQMADRTAAAIREALPKLKPVVRVVGTRAKADRLASNRRVPQPDGSLLVRGSGTCDPKLQEAPEGLIDPWLRTVTFFDAERPIQSCGSLREPTLDRGAIHDFRPLVQLHYYATHPMSFYGDARISWDVPGLARQRLEQETGVFQIYFNGCGGNIGMGKYNDGTRAAREQLTDRMFDAMRRSARVAAGGEATETEKLDATVEVRSLKPAEIAWDQAELRFTVREDGAFNAAILREQLQAGRPFTERMKAAVFSAWTARLNAGHRVSVSRLKLGSLQLVHLPGEPFVEFQLFAQQVAPANSFVCVAGYGECGVWYYGPDSIFRDRGGYEQSWSLTGPCQASVEAVLGQLLASPKKPASRP